MHSHFHQRLGIVAALLPLIAFACEKATVDEPKLALEETGKRDGRTEAESKVPPREKKRGKEELCVTRSPIYNSKGVHNDCLCLTPNKCTDACAGDRCDAKRRPADPADPEYPANWVSEWNMYRVFSGFTLDKDGQTGTNLPPWSDPPRLLKPTDYQKSTGATYYDDHYVPEDKDGTGAMMERYNDYCLPIFPLENDFSCSFISLGNKAYFLTYDKDRPKDMPSCCMFSPYNHPPRRDFIKHLPYSVEDSSHLEGKLQAYRYVTPGDNIWFAYGFWQHEYLDPEKKYLKPQSFYFSGFPGYAPEKGKKKQKTPVAPFAPFVSQNYTNFRIEKPNPANTWSQVEKMCTATPLPDCELFDPPPDDVTAAEKLGKQAEGAASPRNSALWSSQQFPNE